MCNSKSVGDGVVGDLNHPQAQEKIERWHQTLKNRILFEHYYRPGDLERQVATFVAHYNHARYHESLDNLTPAATTLIQKSSLLENLTLSQRR